MERTIEVRTMDGVLVELSEKLAKKSNLLRNIVELTTIDGPIELMIESKYFEIIKRFMHQDNHHLKDDYNPLELYFSNEIIEFFSEFSTEDILILCVYANYLEYCFLLEISCKIIANSLGENEHILDMIL